MMKLTRLSAPLLVAGLCWAQVPSAAMYKWVDENGKTHYGDTIPAKYANRAPERLNKSGAAPTKVERPAQVAETRPTEQEIEKQKADAKRLLEQRRQDVALLATYSNEKEIDQARERELKRHQELIGKLTAGLAKSKHPEDKAKLDNLLDQSRKETDAINSKFDAQKARFQEIARGTAVAQAPGSKP